MFDISHEDFKFFYYNLLLYLTIIFEISDVKFLFKMRFRQMLSRPKKLHDGALALFSPWVIFFIWSMDKWIIFLVFFHVFTHSENITKHMKSFIYLYLIYWILLQSIYVAFMLLSHLKVITRARQNIYDRYFLLFFLKFALLFIKTNKFSGR